MPPIVFGSPTIINIGGYGGSGFYGGGFCSPMMYGCRRPLFGFGYRGFGMGFPFMCCPMNPCLAMGFGIGSLIGLGFACPEFGKALAWPFQQLWKGDNWLYNNAIKPACQWIGKGIKKACKSIKNLFTKKKDKKTEGSESNN